MTEPEPTTGKVARDAAVSSLVSNGVYLAIMIGLAVVLTRRDWVVRQAARVRASMRQEWRGWHETRQVADFNREVSEWEHGES
jgi:hypothetical protein